MKNEKKIVGIVMIRAIAEAIQGRIRVVCGDCDGGVRAAGFICAQKQALEIIFSVEKLK